jgi:hypothetical protein
MVLVDYIGIFFYMLQYFWPHNCRTRKPKINQIPQLIIQIEHNIYKNVSN